MNKYKQFLYTQTAPSDEFYQLHSHLFDMHSWQFNKASIFHLYQLPQEMFKEIHDFYDGHTYLLTNPEK